MHGLDRILGKASHLAVLRVLNDTDTPLSGREVQRRSGLSNRAAMLALEALCEQNVLLCEVTKTAYLYQANARHYLWNKAIRPAFDAEYAFWDDLGKTVRRSLTPRPDAAMVTGTLARDERATEGRLDLHLLFSGGRQRLQAYRCLERLSQAVRLRYSLDVHATFMDIRTMDDPEYQDLWRRIAREGILLFGKLP